MPMAAAAYNAGPSRPRNWRNGPVMEAAIWAENCLLYTSDAADDLLCVDLGGRRIIKKKTSSIQHILITWTTNHNEQNTSLEM